jgi:hypothetical protein
MRRKPLRANRTEVSVQVFIDVRGLHLEQSRIYTGCSGNSHVCTQLQWEQSRMYTGSCMDSCVQPYRVYGKEQVHTG